MNKIIFTEHKWRRKIKIIFEELNDRDYEILADYAKFFKAHITEIKKAFNNADNGTISSFHSKNQEFKDVDFFVKALNPLELGIKTKIWDNYISIHRNLGYQYAKRNVDFAKYFLMFLEYKHIINGLLRENTNYSNDLILRIILGMELVSDTTTAIVSEGYIEHKEQIIVKQGEAIEELSIPILTIRPNVLLVPIIGIVDSTRAMSMTERILNSIRDQEAKIVIIDVTGMPIVDTSVANHFVQTANASRFMGAMVIISGISPELAMTMAKLGISLKSIIVCSDLQDGISEGEKILGEYPKINGA